MGTFQEFKHRGIRIFEGRRAIPDNLVIFICTVGSLRPPLLVSYLLSRVENLPHVIGLCSRTLRVRWSRSDWYRYRVT